MIIESAILVAGIIFSVNRYCEMREYIHLHSRDYTAP